MEQVVQAVQSLHDHSVDPAIRQEALKWLERFQNTVLFVKVW